jgi:hypothetical protein
MGFWSTLGKIGKVAAPIAAGAFGGPAAAMAVSGGLNALDKKMHGGSWKSALGAGALGAAESYGASKLGGSVLAKAMKGRTPSFAGGDPTGVRSAIADTASRATRASMGPSQSTFARIMGNIGTGARTAQDVMGAVNMARGARTPGIAGGYPGMPMNRGGRMPMGNAYGMAMQRNNANAPNLADSIMRGRQEAIMNQPFRQGDRMLTGYGPEPADDAQGNVGAPIYQQMPRIYPNVPDRRMMEPQGRGIGPSYMPMY